MQSRKYRVSETRRSSFSEENNGKFNTTFKITMLVVFFLCLIIIIVSCISWKSNSNKSSSKTNNTYRSEEYIEKIEEEKYTDEQYNFNTDATTTKKPNIISSTNYQMLKTNPFETSQSTSSTSTPKANDFSTIKTNKPEITETTTGHNDMSSITDYNNRQTLKTNQFETSRSASSTNTPRTNDFSTIKMSNTDLTKTTTGYNEMSSITNYNNYSSNESNETGDNNTVTPHYNKLITTHANTDTNSTHNYSYEDQSTTILDKITTYNWLLSISNSTTYRSNEISHDYESTTPTPSVKTIENDYTLTTTDDSSSTTEHIIDEATPTENINISTTENYEYYTTDSDTSTVVSTTENNNYETSASENDIFITKNNDNYTTTYDQTYSTNNNELITEDNVFDTSSTENFDNEFEAISTTDGQLIFDDVTEEIDQNDDNKVYICESGSCKHLAGKMLSYMNHSVDPCEDLYEYACGNLETDPQIISRDLSKQVFDQIKKSLEMNADNEWYQPFSKYLNSCIKYDEYLMYDEKIEEVKKTVEKVGMFHTEETWPKKSSGYSIILTKLLTESILNNNPLLFNIVPNVHETNSQKFILQIIPTIGNYKYFHNPMKQKMYVQPIDYDVPRWLNEVENSFKKIQKFITDKDININFQTLQKYFMSYSSSTTHINKIFEEKDYSMITWNELSSESNLIKWESVVSALTGMTLELDSQLQIYLNHQVLDALNKLENSDESERLQVYNALLGLYTTNLYKQMVHNRIHSYEQCLTISMKFLPSQSSSLYMSALSKIQLYHFEQLIDDIFMELKETLRLKFKKLQWASNEGQEYLLKKLADIKLSLPDTLIYTGSPEQLTDNFFTNTLVLMKKHRRSMYSNLMNRDPNDSKELWTYFARPFQTSPQTIHSLSVILLPFGAIDWYNFQYYKEFDHSIYASIGNLLAREIAHFFDTNGMQYWNKTRVGSPFAFIDDDWTKAAYHEFINCQRDILFQEPIEVTVPLSNQSIQYRVPSLTLNERLADVIGIKLAQETLNRIHTSHVSKLLPWLPLNTHQLFFLEYAQTYCTKSQLEDFTNSYDTPTLPSRIRILAVAVNNKNIGQAWNCPEGSLTFPTSLCDVFPDLNYERDMMENLQISIN